VIPTKRRKQDDVFLIGEESLLTGQESDRDPDPTVAMDAWTDELASPPPAPSPSRLPGSLAGTRGLCLLGLGAAAAAALGVLELAGGGDPAPVDHATSPRAPLIERSAAGAPAVAEVPSSPPVTGHRPASRRHPAPRPAPQRPPTPRRTPKIRRSEPEREPAPIQVAPVSSPPVEPTPVPSPPPASAPEPAPAPPSPPSPPSSSGEGGSGGVEQFGFER
jgi:hypothetical protein